MLKKWLIGSLMIALFFMSSATPSYAFWWMGYHKPAFKGKVIDAATKEPIEGAVVVVVYSKTAIRIGPESNTITMDVREALTDKEGIFSIPSYTTIIDPLAWEDLASFINFKPGYGSFPDWRVLPSKGTEVHFEDFFSDDFGKEKEVLWREPWKVGAESKKIKVTFGVVELPPLRTREEREKKGLHSRPDPTIPDYKVKNLMKAINEENAFLGFPLYKLEDK